MRKVMFFVLFALFCWCAVAVADDTEYEPLGKSVVAKSDGSVSSFTLPTGRVYTAFITLEAGGIRFYYDGSTPDQTTGHYAPPGASVECRSTDEVRNFKWTMDSASSGVTATVTFFGKRQ